MSVLHDFNLSDSYPLKVLNKLFNNVGRFDVAIVSETKRILAHKLILSANSDHFNELFKEEPDIEEITCWNLNEDVLEQCVKFCYSGQVVFTNENIIDMVIVSGLFQFNTIEKEAMRLLTNNLKSDHLIQSILTNTPCKNPKESTLKNDPEIANIVSKEWVVCIAKQAKKINLLNDIEMLEFFKIWIEKNPKERQACAAYFLTCFDLKRSSMEFLWNHVRHFCIDDASTKLYEEAMDLHVFVDKMMKLLDKNKVPDTKIVNTKELLPKPVDDMRIWMRVRIEADHFLIDYSPRESTFSTINKLKKSIGFKNLILDNKIFHVIGDKIRFYDIGNQEWGDLEKMVEGIIYCCVFESNLYAVSKSLTIFRYNFYDSSWKQFGQRWFHYETEKGASFVILNSRLYAIGGGNSLHPLKSFDFKTGKWQSPTHLMHRNYLRLAACAGIIYAFSGPNSADGGPFPKSVEKYDPRRDRWTFLPDWSLPELPLHITVLQDQIFIITESFDLVKYDPKDNQIIELTHLQPRLGLDHVNFINLE